MPDTFLFSLYLAFSFNILLHKQVFAVVNHVGEVTDPIAEDDNACLLGELQVNLDVAMTIDEIVYVGVILNVFLSVENQMLFVFTHKDRSAFGLVLHA